MAVVIKSKNIPTALVPPPPREPDPDPIPQVAGRALVDHAKYEDIARRLIMGQKSGEVATDIGYTDRHMRRILLRPEFIEVYHEVARTFYADLDKVMLDEKIRPLQRAQAQAVRAQTLLAEVMGVVRERIGDGSVKATELKVGADTALAVIDRSKNELTPDGAPRVAVQLNINTEKRDLLRQVAEESGVDLSDLGVIDVEPVEDDDPPVVETPTDG